MSDMIPEGTAQNGIIPQNITDEEAQAMQMATGRMGWNRPEKAMEKQPAESDAIDTSTGIDAVLAAKGTKKKDLYEPLYEGAPEGVYKPAAYASFFKEVIQNAPDPAAAEARLNGAYMLAQVEGLPFEEAFQNYDALIQSYYQKALSPKDALSAITTTYRTAKLGTQLADLAYQLGQSGGDNEAILKEMDRLKAYMPAPDEIKRNLPTEFVKAAAQFAPSMIESLKAGSYGGAQAITIAASSIAAGVATGAIATEGIGAVSLPVLLFGVYRAGAAAGTARRTFELETGSCYYDLLETTQTRVGTDGKEIVERVDPKVAWQFAQIYGALAAATEALPADQMLMSTAKAFGLKEAIEATKTVQNTAERAGIIKTLFKEFLDKTRTETGERVVNVATESVQEVVQQALQLSAEEIAKQITNTEQGTKLDPITRQEYQQQIVDTLVSSLAGMTTFAAGTGAVSLIKDASVAGTKAKKAGDVNRILAAEEVDTPFTKMSDEDVALFHKRSTEGELPKGVYLTRSTIVEGSEYAYNAIDPATKKPVGSVRFEFIPWESEEMPGVVHILGIKAGADPRVNYELMKSVENTFAGWNIEFEPVNQSQAALKAVMVAENPRGEGHGLNWYTAERETTKATVQGLVDKIAQYAPNWKKDELDVVAWTMDKIARHLGTTGDKLAAGMFAPGIVTARTMKMGDREVKVGTVIDASAASQGTAGAFITKAVGDAFLGLIEMGPGSNPSTALHEISHATINFMQEVRRGAVEFEGKEKIIAELAAIEKAWGVVNGQWNDQSNAWTGEGTPTNQSHWEAFTYAMEDYLLTGKAPRPELESIFARFAQWIKAIYQGLKGARVNLTPEMTAYFDRLFGSEEDPFTEAELTPKEPEGVMPVREEAPLEIWQGRTEDRAGRAQALERAKKLADEGKSDDEIEQATGWRNRQGTWESPRSRKYTREAPEIKPEPVLEMNGARPKPLYQGAKWVYKAEEAIQKKPWGKMAGRQILSMLKGAGVKQEELTWTGLMEYLDTDEKRTPADVLEFLAANKLEIKEKKFSNKKEKSPGVETVEKIDDKWWIDFTDGSQVDVRTFEAETEEEAIELAREYREDDNYQPKNTKYHQYVTPGGENYREVLFTLPGENQYQSNHWNEKNVLAHTRLADHTIAGKSTLLVEEIQSDWHQAGREHGYKDGDQTEYINERRLSLYKERKALVDKYNDANDLLAARKHFTLDEDEQDTRIANELVNLVEMESKLPDAPFKKTWHEFVLKRLMHEAADKNYEAIAWTSGAQQAERYALTKTIDVIGYSLRGDNLANVTVWGKNGGLVYTNQSSTREDLDGVIGKELTNRIFSGEGRKDGPATYLEGLDLETGGEGMKSFYDRDLVNYANKLLKPFGVQVKDAALDTAPDAGPVHTVEITQAVRDHVLTQGFTLFQNGRGTESAERNNLFSTDIPEILLAPNGKKSNLNITQWRQVRTPAFKAWFGDWENNPKEASKIVDENGEPRVVYHGTPKGGFSVFNEYEAGSNTANVSNGFYFTEDRRNAMTYSNNRDEVNNFADYDEYGETESGIYSVFLNIRDPLEEDMGGRSWDGSKDGEYEPDARSIPQIENEITQSGEWDGAIIKNVMDEGRYGQGYGWGEITFIALKPEQIKSAFANNGEFSRDNPSILYQGEHLGDPIPTIRGSVITAINELRTRKAGIVEGAATREPIGDIAIPWGWEGDESQGFNNGWGLAKILKKHDKRDNVIANLERILKEGAIYQDPEHAERVWILHGPYRAVVATYRGYGRDRVYGPWLMTAYTHELSRGTESPFIPAGATLIAEGTAAKQEKRKVVVKRRNVLYQGGRQVAEIEYAFPSTLKGFSDIHSQGQLPAEIQVFGRGVVDPKTGAVSIGPVGSSHAQLAAGITDAKRFYFGYNRAEEKAYIVAKNSLDENVVYDPKNTKMILSAVFDKYKLGVKPGAKYALKSRPALFQGNTDSEEFKRFFGKSKVVDVDGKPLRVYHGTTHTIESFDRSRANIENDMGAGFYFSSDWGDANRNYTGEGPDLTQRMGIYKDMIRDSVAEDPEGWGLDPEDYDLDDALEEIARAKFHGGDEHIIESYLAIENPVILSEDREDNPTYLEYEYDEETGEETGSLIDFIEALREAAAPYVDFGNSLDIDHAIADMMEKGADYDYKVSVLRDALKTSDGLQYAEDPDAYQETGTGLVASEIIRKAFEIMGFDGIIDHTVAKKFSGMNLKEGTTHYIAFHPWQIKDVNNTGSWSREDPRILFQNAQEQISPNLVAIHNLSAEKLRHAAELGGLAMPSLAIINKNIPMESFGDITLIAPKEMVDPQASKTTKLYNADVYSPRWPDATKEVNRAVVDKGVEKIYPAIVKAYSESKDPYYRDNIPTAKYVADHIEQDLENNREDMTLYYRPVISAFLADHGRNADPFETADPWETKDKKGDDYNTAFAKWWQKNFPGVIAKKKLFKGFTNAGRRRYVPYTLENVFAEMKKERVRGGENFTYGLPSIRAAIAKQYKSLAAVKKDEKYLVSDEAFEEVKKETDALFHEILEELTESYPSGTGVYISGDTICENIIEGIERRNVRAVFEGYGFNPKTETLEKVNLLLSTLREMPTEYFEAKLVRTVSLSEFAGAIVPVGTSPEIKGILEEAGLETWEYAGGGAGRAAALTTLAQRLDRGTILFQNGIDAYRPAIARIADDMTAEHPEAKPADVAVAIGATLAENGAEILEAGEQDGSARVLARAGAKAWDITVPLDAPEALKIMPTSPRILFQENAWHGSVADFDQFSTDFIGTGEGAGHYGWGIYLTGSEAIGRYYANDVAQRVAARKPWTIGGQAFANLAEEIQKAVVDSLAFAKDLGLDADPAEIAKAIRETGAEGAEDAAKAMESGDNTIPVLEGKRKLYQVIIDKDTTLLDWEKAMTKQSPAVRACLAKAGIVIPDNEEMIAKAESGESIVGPGQARNAWMTWGEYYQDWLNRAKPRDIAMTLRDAGIVGVKYPAIPRGDRAEQDQTNYVIFDEGAVSVRRKILYQGEGEKQRAEQIQDAGKPDGANAELYRTAREMAGEGKTWEHLMEYAEETKDWLPGGDKIPDLEPEQKRAWYKALWEAANKVAEKGDEINAWISSLADDGYGNLKAFLATIWSDVMVRENEDAGFGFSEQDAAEWEAGRARAAEIRAQLPEPMIAGAINMGAHGGKMSAHYLASLMGIIRANPEEYAAMYGVLMNDEKIGALGAEAAARKDHDFQDDERMNERMSISERAALRSKIRNERLEREIMNGKVKDKDVKAYIDRIKKDAEAGRKRIAEMELEIKDAEAQIDANGREIGQNRRRLVEAKTELTRTMKRIESLVEKNATIPASLESRRAILERQTETLRKRLATAGDWIELDARLAAAEKRLSGAIQGRDEYRARNEATPYFIIEAISNAQREIDEIKTKQAATKDYRNSAQLTTYLAKIEAETKLKSHLREIEAERKALRELRAYKAKLVRSIMKPAGEGIFYEYQTAIQKIQDEINPENTSKRTQEKIDLLRAELAENPSLKSEVSRTWIKRAFAKNLNEMTLEDLEQTERRVRELRSTGRALQKRNAAERAEMYEYLRNEIGDVLMRHPNYQEPEGYKPEQTEKEKILNRLGLGKYAWQEAHRFFRDLDGGVEGKNYELFIKERDRYWREEMKNSRRRKEAVLKGFKDAGIDPAEWYNSRVTIAGVGPNGIDKVLRKSDLAACEMAFRDENSRQAVLFGCFFSAKEKRELSEESLMFEGSRRFQLIRAAIDANLTEQDYAIIDGIFRKDAQENGDRLATIYGAASNKVLGRVEEYFPLRREGVNGEPIYDQIAGDLGSRQPGLRKPPKNGFTNKRITISPKHQKPVKLDILSTWMDSIDAQEHYINTVLYGQKLDGIYLDPFIQEGIRAAKGDAGLLYVMEYIAEIKNPHENAYKNQWESSIRDLRGNLGVAYLALKSSSIVKQLITSPWPALPYAGPRLFTEAMKMMTNPVKYVEAAEEKSVYLKNRTQDQVFEAIKANANAQGITGAIKKFDDVAMKGLEIADRLCVSIGWRAMYEAERARTGDETKAIEFADDKTQMTQPSARGVDLPPIYRNAGEATRLLLQFTSALNVIYQNLRYDVPNAIRNRQWATAIGTIVGYMIAGVLVNAATQRPDPDDDDETRRQKLMFYSLTQATDCIPLIGQDVTRVVNRAITGEKSTQFGDQTLPGIQAIADGMYRLSGGEIDRAMVRFAEGGGMIVGMPVSGIKELGRAATGDLGALAGWKKEKEDGR